MAKVFDDDLIARAFRDASEALRRGDPDTLAGHFSPKAREPEPAKAPAATPRRKAAG